MRYAAGWNAGSKYPQPARISAGLAGNVYILRDVTTQKDPARRPTPEAVLRRPGAQFAGGGRNLKLDHTSSRQPAFDELFGFSPGEVTGGPGWADHLGGTRGGGARLHDRSAERGEAVHGFGAAAAKKALGRGRVHGLPLAGRGRQIGILAVYRSLNEANGSSSRAQARREQRSRSKASPGSRPRLQTLARNRVLPTGSC